MPVQPVTIAHAVQFQPMWQLLLHYRYVLVYLCLPPVEAGLSSHGSGVYLGVLLEWSKAQFFGGAVRLKSK